MANTFYIVRHGETNWNILGKTQGHGNSNLTEKGIEQATTLAESMSKYPIDYIYSSDLGRAVETANILADVLNLEVNETNALREMGFGVWEGLLMDEIKENYADMYSIWRNTPHLFDVPGGETLSIIQDRVDEFIKEINEKYDNKHILLVSHSVTVRVILLS
ncbi:MAG: histidine phosphatase family protein, partial [Peptostreptococcaceae bacterium]|nr:histidine phosphatase family protein [Peptostreptococcaceae bacterium]